MIFKVLILAGLIRLLIATEQPFLCSGIYAGGVLILGLIFGVAFVPMLIAASISFALASLYFWLLVRFEGYGVLWWLILVLGLAIGLV